mmetsp:Transcript_15259/g.32948  ORF Transcript_15259/g.32948 Transcript_15259/m.32948 type:complete len:523 (-) Transcript_15259:46-1614(-)
MELVENPENCDAFEPHPFKPTKCRDCGRPWTEHKGVIADKYYNGFVNEIRRAEEEKRRAEEEAKAKSREAKALKKQNSAAPEDKWLFEGNHNAQPDNDGESSGDDGGFQMLTPSTIQRDKPKPNPIRSQPLMVKNLIDFDECDVNAGPGLGQPGPSSYEASTAPGTASSLAGLGRASSPGKIGQEDLAPASALASSSLGSGSLASPAAAAAAGRRVSIEAPSPTNSPAFRSSASILAGEEDDLRAEIILLRQQLADSVEMKNIEVDIIRDEVSMKQSEIDALAAKHEETEKQLQELKKHLEHTQLEASSVSPSAKPDPELLGKLRTELEEYREAAAKSRAQEEQLSRLRDELHEHRECASLEAQLMVEQAKLEGEERVSSLQAELENLKMQAAAQQANAVPSAAEVERLRASLAEARAREVEQEDSRRMAEAAAQKAKDEAEQERRAKLELEDILNSRSPQSSGGSSPAKSVVSQHEALKTAEMKNQEAEKVLMQIRRQAENQLMWLSQRVKEDPKSELVAA